MIATNVVHTGDALEFLRTLPDACADLVIADPPYSLGKDREFGDGAYLGNREAWLAWCHRWLLEGKRLLAPAGNLFVYAIHHNACFIQTYLYEIGLEYRRQIVWHYENGWSKYRNGPACHYESIIWFAKRRDSTFHVIREPYKSTERLRHTITKNGRVWTPNPDGRQAGDVWRFPTLAGRRFAPERTEHPTQKPLSLSRRLVEHFSNPGDLVVVPFVGSGSECVAAIECGRRFVGCEINAAYAHLARRRIAAAFPRPLPQIDGEGGAGRCSTPRTRVVERDQSACAGTTYVSASVSSMPASISVSGAKSRKTTSATPRSR